MAMIDYNMIGLLVNDRIPYSGELDPSIPILICVAKQGPSMIPILIDNLEQCSSIFGADSEATNSYIEFANNSSSAVYIIRINGEQLSATLKNSDDEDILILKNISPKLNELFADAKVEENILTINNYENINRATIEFDENTKIDDIINIINYYARMGVLNVYAVKVKDGVLKNDQDIVLRDVSTYSIAGNYDIEEFIEPREVYNRLKILFDNLMNVDVKNIGIVSSQFANILSGNLSTYELFASFVNRKLEVNQPCEITIGLNTTLPDSDLKTILVNGFEKYGDYYEDYDTTFLPMYQISEFINIIIARLKISGANDNYTSNGVPTICALIQESNKFEPRITKPIKGILNNLLLLTKTQVKDFTDNGYLTIINEGGTNRVFEGVTPLARNSVKTYVVANGEAVEISKCVAFKRVSNVLFFLNFIRDIENLIVCDDYTTFNDIDIVINNLKSNYKNVIRYLDYDINYKIEGYSVYYIVNIELSLYGEVSKLNVSVTTGGAQWK